MMFLGLAFQSCNNSKTYAELKDEEREAIKRENDTEKLKQLSKEIDNLKETEKAEKAKWQAEKSLIDNIQQHKIDIEQLKFDVEAAERNGDFNAVAEISGVPINIIFIQLPPLHTA